VIVPVPMNPIRMVFNFKVNGAFELHRKSTVSLLHEDGRR
jgi:hypothetical protein